MVLSIKVLVISLKKSIERREYITQQLRDQNINFEFFDAIDGKEKDNPIFKRYDYCKRRWLSSGKFPTDGEMGCYASHYSLWKYSAKSQCPIVVLEDDARINKDASIILECVEKEIEKYGFLRLEDPIRGELIKVQDSASYSISWMSDNFGGLRAYAIAPWAAEGLLRKSERWHFPVDNYVGYNFIHKIESYQLSPYLADHGANLETTIQFYEGVKTPLYVKPSRELYTAYRKIRKFMHNYKIKKGLKVNVK